MCGIVGIVGIVGLTNATDQVLEGLRAFESRGYDSSGIGLTIKPNKFNRRGEFRVFKEVGTVDELQQQLARQVMPETANVMGHTRWATSGRPTRANAHPHVSASGAVMVAHDGTIDNFEELRQGLVAKGYAFVSDTDTEVIANLIESFFLSPPTAGSEQSQPMQAIIQALNLLKGAWAIAVSFACLPDDRLYVAVNHMPLVIGFGKGAMYVASDPEPLRRHTKNFYSLEDGECARISPDGLHERATIKRRRG